jgi:hypothetical protein
MNGSRRFGSHLRQPALFRVMFIITLNLSIARASVAQEATQPDPFHVEWSQSRLSVQARNIPLRRILNEIARKTEIQMNGIDLLRETVTVNLDQAPLYDGLRTILDGKDYVLIHFHESSDHPPTLTLMILGQPGSSPSPFVYTPSHTQGDQQETTLDPNERLSQLEGSIKEQPANLRDILHAAAQDSEPFVRELAYRQLYALDEDDARNLLERDASSDDVDLRRTALSSFFDLYHASHPSDVLDMLTEAASDDNLDIRTTAFESLTRLEGGLVEIERKLDDPDPEIRIVAIDVMASQGQESAWNAISLLRQDPDEQVRSRVNHLFLELNDEDTAFPGGSVE